MSEPEIDPATLQVIWNRLDNIVEEMGVYLRRTAVSPVVKYSDDFSTGLYTWDGRLIAQGHFEPAFLGCMPTVMDEILAHHVPIEDWNPGDLVVTNDPYIGAGHFPDVFVFEPIFHEEDLVGFATNVINHYDMGGAETMPGPIDARNWYEEGLHIPPVKLYERGEPNDAALDMFFANVRAPRMVEGDFDAQRASTRRGRERYAALIDEFGFDAVKAYMEEILTRSEQAMRAAIKKIPDGSYSGEDWLDGFDDPLAIRVEVTVDDDGLLIDFAGTADQLDDYAINSTLSFTYAESLYAITAALEPGVSNTGGSSRPITITAPSRSLVNPEPPAPLGHRHVVLNHIVSAIFRALGDAGLDLPAAGTQAHTISSTFEGDHIFEDLFFGGAGARPDRDGFPAVGGCQNLKNIPVEVVEADNPVRVTQYELVRDTAGAGRHRGGAGTVREVEYFSPARIKSRCERFEFGPFGVHGGEEGIPGEAVLNPETEDERAVRSKETLNVDAGDVFRVRTHGGGGYGDPAERPTSSVVADVENGLVSPEKARDVYGLTREETSAIDVNELLD